MSDRRVGVLLLCTILVMTAVPLAAALYFVDQALQTSLNLGFNPQILRALESGSANLKTLKNLDPGHAGEYREQFEAIESLQRVYARPQWVKERILGSLEIYFGAGLAAAVLLSVVVAALLGRRISGSYRHTFNELLAHRERVRYLEEMSSWQELARVLAHEIKNPLTPIEVLVTSLGKAYQSRSPEEFREQLTRTQAMIGEELAHLKRTVSRFSEFARLPEVQLTEARPVEVIRQHLAVVAASFETAQLELEARSSPADLRARMDPSLFRHVLMNVVRNGVEANPGRPIAFHIRVTHTESWIRVAISNDGEPVRADLAARIFDPYVSSKPGKDNMGLGLAIVKKIIIEHGGEIAYAEEAGHPQFTLCLPRVSA
jgi:signal transduction histidine kinase